VCKTFGLMNYVNKYKLEKEFVKGEGHCYNLQRSATLAQLAEQSLRKR
jgi:hypothetical protein